MTVKISPVFNDAQLDSSGNPATGYKLFTYTAGSSTKQTVYQDSAGLTQHTNPILLNSRGEPPAPIWLTTAGAYKFVFTSPTDTDPPVSPIRTVDNVSGVNDTTLLLDQWVAGPTPTFVSTTSFTLLGDQTSVFHAGRRVKTTNSGGSIYSTIVGSAFTTLTTLTVVNDSGVLDSGLSAVSYGIVSAINTSVPLVDNSVSVINFGAIGDGTTDDTTAAQAAITTGKRVIFPQGYTFLTQGLTVATAKQEICIRGVVKLKNTTNQSVFTVSASRVKFRFEGGEIDGNKANQSTTTDSLGSGIWLADGVAKVEIWDQNIHDCKRNGIAGFGNNNDCVVIGGENVDNAVIGIYPSQASNRPNKRWQISGVTISGFGQDGIGTVAIQHSVISGNRILHPSDGTAIACVALEAECNWTSVFGNTFEGTASVGTSTANGVQVNDSHTVSVTGNTFDGLGQAIDLHGAIAGSYNVSVTGNSIVDCGYTGAAIIVGPTTPGDYGASIIGNTIRDCPFSAIHLSGAQHCTVSGNQINGVNLQNTASKRFVSGIGLYNQAFYNTIYGNSVLEGASGNMKIGIHEHAPSAGNGAGINTIRDNRIVGADFDIICSGTAQSLSVYSKVTRTQDTAVTAAPSTGHWERGDVVWNEQPASGGAPGWACTTTGTFSATATTGSITNGSFTLTVASAVGLYAGMAIRVAGAGVAAANLDTYIQAFDGTGLTCTLRDAASTTVVGVAVSTPAALNPVFKAMANLA